MRLWLVYPAALLTAVGLVIWGVSVDRAYHWMVGQVAFALCKSDGFRPALCPSGRDRTMRGLTISFLVGAGIQIGNTSVCSYIVDAYPMQTMAVMTFYAVMLNLSAFADPFFIIPWVETAGFTWTLAVHALITVFFCIPSIALLHRFGGRIREKSGVLL